MNAIVGGLRSGQNWKSEENGNASDRLDSDPLITGGPELADAAAVDVQAEFAQAEDDASVMFAQFGRFRGTERRASRSEDLERILESDADEKMDELASRFKGQKPDRATLLSDARQRFGDGSDLMLALRELRRRKRLDAENVDEIEAALEELLNSEEKKRIKAGANAALKARMFGARMERDPRQLRDLYRQFVEFEGAYLTVYEYWIEQFGADKRKSILEYIGSALSYDMQSLEPSCDCSADFGPLLDTLQNVRTLSSADDLFVKRIVDDTLRDDCQLTEAMTLKVMLDGLQRPFDIGEVLLEILGERFSVLPAARTSELLQLLLWGFSSVPISLFEEENARPALMEAIQEMIGTVYKKERRVAYRRTTRKQD